MKTALAIVAIAMLFGPAVGEVSEPPADVPPLDPGIIMVEGSGAVLGGAVCAAGFGFLLKRLYDPSEDVWKTFGGTVLGGSLGYPVFCGLGCWASARLVKQQGQLNGAIIGALAATPVALTVAWIGTLVERLPPGSVKSSPMYAVAALIPPAGAILGYNFFRPRSGPAGSVRLSMPEVLIATESGEDGSPLPVLDVRLVNARF